MAGRPEAGAGQSPSGGDAAQTGRLSAGKRTSLFAFGFLALIVFGPLYVLPDRTDQLFAWTVQPPVTAGLLGAGYGAGLVAVLYSLWSRQWQHILLWVHGFFVFVAVTAAATFMHLERFHLDAGGLAQTSAWAWLVVYIVLPIWTLALLAFVHDGDQASAGEQPPWPAGLAVALWTQAVVLTAIGVTLFVAPETEGWLWPWDLTALTARAVAAWLLASATLAFVMVRERGPARVDVAAAAYATLPVLMVISLPRFANQVDWGQPAASVLVALLVVMAATGLIALARSRRLQPSSGG